MGSAPQLQWQIVMLLLQQLKAAVGDGACACRNKKCDIKLLHTVVMLIIWE